MAVHDRLRSMIASSGPIGFDQLVGTALYDSDHGWYATGGQSGRRDGHFITSPEVGPLFGRVVARWLDERWIAASRPDVFVVAEIGAGRGRLARSIFAAVPQCLAALRYVMVEQSAAQRSEHDDVLACAPGQVRSESHLPPIDGNRGRLDVVLANELLDNLPFHVVRRDCQRVAGDGWAEVRVGLDSNGELTEVLAPLTATPEEMAVLRRAGSAATSGAVIDVPLAREAVRFVQQMSARARHLLIFDYGEPTAVLAGRPDRGWLRTYRNNGRGSGPLRDVGFQDITIDVPLDQLPPPRRATRQADWLERHGLAAELQAADQVLKENPGTANLAAIRARSAAIEAAALTDRSGLGNFVVAEW